jgi:hypothetical protein
LIPDIIEVGFPDYATLTHATVSLADMGEKSIATQIKIDAAVAPDFSHDWELRFQGERYIMPLRKPQGSKDNTTLNATIDLTFQHWAIYQLKRWMFFSLPDVETGSPSPDKWVVPLQLNLRDFCAVFARVLEYWYGDTITLDLNPAWKFKAEPSTVDISYSFIWDVLIKLYEIYAVRWSIEPTGDADHYVIRIGYPAVEVEHIFEYGFEGGLLKVKRQVQSEEIRNMLLGRGGDKNIPLRYFKDKDPGNPRFSPDPDWVQELANIYFDRLRGATFRSYVQGWKAAHISEYPGYTAVGEDNAYAPWAYRKGYTDAKFDPVEYVKDDESILLYGPLLGALDDNDDFYPTIQGAGLDIAVDVEQILSDDVQQSSDAASVISDVKGGSLTQVIWHGTTASFVIPCGDFVVPSDSVGVLVTASTGASAYWWDWVKHDKKVFREQFAPNDFEILSTDIDVFDSAGNKLSSSVGIPPGAYTCRVRYEVINKMGQHVDLVTTISCNGLKLTTSASSKQWSNTFDIWVKNIWDSAPLPSESDSAYARRVWEPVLGDREGSEAKVLFTTGNLAVSDDYEFTIVEYPVPDSSKSYTSPDGVTHQSHWRIRLAKSDADLESTGMYVPSTKRQGAPGDRFVFIGTEMTHIPYVVDAERRLDDWKTDNLADFKDIRPTWVVTTDRVRLNNEGRPDALIGQLRIGNSIRLADSRFIQPIGDKAYETLYLQSLTITYREPSSDDAALNPDVEIVLGNDYAVSANPVSTMQGDISAIQQQLGSISNVEQIVRAVGDSLYLRKDGISDRSLSPTQFFSLLTSGDFRNGVVGGAGWGFFKDEDGNWVLETDRINVRSDLQVNNLVINQVSARGGMQIDTAASITITKVIETQLEYICYFDQKNGSVANLFKVGDVAMSMVYDENWDTDANLVKAYRRRVTAVAPDSISLTKERDGDLRPSWWVDNGVNGSGVPSVGDVVVHFGNYNEKARQYVKVRDVVGGGYERFIDGLDSVNASGVEYFFVGRQAGMYGDRPRWFVGDTNGYIEWVNGHLDIKGRISVLSTIGGKPVGDYVSDAAKAEADKAKAELEASIKALQEQVDGVIESFSGFGAPSLTNFPAVEWTTDAERKAHDRDIYTDRTPYVDDATTPTSGHSWKWYYNTPSDYGWTKIADSDAVKALQMAQMSVRDSDVYFISHTSATSAPPLPVIGINGEITDAKGWSTSAPAWQQDKYIWQTTYTVKGDGSVSFTDPTCISGRNGKGIASITEQYYLSTSRDNPVGSSVGWTDRDHREQWTVGKYWWTRSKITYTDGSSEYIGEVCVSGADGANGTSVLARYSADGSNWHPTMLPTDIYMQTSSDGGQSWSPVMRFMGSSYTENLMLNTDKQIGGLYTDDGDHWEQWPDHKVRMEQGKTYTISAFTNSPAFTDVHLGSIGLQRCTLWLVTPSPQPSEGAVNQVVSGTDMATDGSTGHTFVWSHPTGDYCLRTNFYSPGIWVVRKVKVEEGRNPSPVWTPSSSEMIGKDGKWQKPQWAKNNDPDNAPTSGWQDAPMTAMPGEYVWTRSGWVIPPATEPSSYGDAVRITGDAGSNGSDVYRLDLDNEMAAVAVRPDGGLDSNSVLPTANASVYKGATKLTSGVVFSIPQYDGVAGVSISPEGKVQVLGTVMSNVARITVQAVVDGVTLTTIMTVYKVKPGHDGASAKVVTVNADSQVFSYADDFSGSPSPSAIRITASVQGIASPVYSWSYKFPGDADFTAYGAETGAVLTLSPAWQQWGNRRSVTWRCTVDGVHDEVTVAKVSSGKNGADAYTVLLTNESHVFEGDDSKAVPSVAECVVTVYKGNVLIPATVGTLSTGVTGLTASFVGGSSGNAVTIQFNATSALTARQGTVEIPITADGKTYSKTFSWSLALRGQSVSVDKGLSSVTYQTSTNYTTPPTGQWLTAVPSVPNGHYLWTRTIVAYTDGNSTTAYSVARQGENGSNGTNGSNGDSYTNNILRNTDFREGDRHWRFMANGVTAVDTSRVFQGRYSVKSAQSGASSMKPCGWIAGGDNEFIPAKKGDVITLSCWVCCDNPSAIDGGVVAEIYWRDTAKQRIATSVYNHASFMPSGPGTWTLRSLTSDVAPEGTAYAELRCQLVQNGTVWFNGIKAEHGANTAPVWTPFAEGTALDGQSVTYAKSSTPSQPSDSAFTATSIGQLGLTPGEYMWSKTEVRYSDGTVTKSYMVARVGTDGEDGVGAPGKDGKTTYVHFAYANSADGVKDFSTTPFAGAKYLGTCTDFNQPDPTTPSSYQWSEYKGSDAVIYEIEPSVREVKRSMSGELSESSVTCAVYKTVGNESRVLSADHTLTYLRLPDGATGTLSRTNGISSAVSILDDTETVVFALYNSPTQFDEAHLLDRERVLVLSDASDMEIGGTNLLRNSAATIERTYTDYGDHYFVLPDRTIHMEQGKIYTISAQTNAEFIDPSKHSNVGGGVLGDWVSLWIVSPSDVTENRVNELVTDTDMAADGSKGHVFKWFKPTGDYVLRVNFYAPGTWWVKKIMIERGNVASAWSPSPEDMDYLTRALRESITMDGGLLLATLIKLGYTDPGGLYKVMAGVNGSYTSPSDIAFWSGGEMVDKLPPQSVASVQAASELAAQTEGATYVMRMNGTGYMADGVLRFEENHIGVGDSVILDNAGLHLMDGDSEKLRVANVAIDDSFLAASMPKQDLSKSADAQVSCSPVSKGSYSYGSHGTSIVDLWTLSLPAGAVISLNLTRYDQWTQPQIGAVQSINAPESLEVVLNGKVVHSGSSSLRYTVRQQGEYTIRHRIQQVVSGAPDSRYTITLTRHLTVMGAVSFPTTDKLTLGNNGLALIFGNIALVAADGKITMRAGDYGFRLSPTLGIQYNTTGLDTGWKNLV